MAKINLIKLQMPEMSVWVKKDEIELFKESFLSEELVTEGVVKLNNRPKKQTTRKVQSSEEHASAILEGSYDGPSKGYADKFNKQQKTINIDGHQHTIGGNEHITDRANGLL